MRIPLVEQLPPNRYSVGPARFYKMALLNTLIYLRPTVCLEIGTNLGGSAMVFAQYFADYCPEGVLVTTDVRHYVALREKSIRQVLVYPHSVDMFYRHDVKPSQLKPDWEKHVVSSVSANCEILTAELEAVGADLFDFAFVDGDHARDSLLKDLEIVAWLVRAPRYTLLDDTIDSKHESGQLYEYYIRYAYDHYDFEDWTVVVGASLVWSKGVTW